jgi:Xaa-Pro dipeptidase
MPLSPLTKDVDVARLPSLYQAHVQALNARYRTVLRKHELSGVLLHAGTPIKRSVFDDQFWSLSVVPHFRHWAPLMVAGSAIWIRADDEPVLFHNVHRDFWEGPQDQETDHFWSSFKVVEVKKDADIRRAVQASIGSMAFVGEDKEAAAAMGFAADRMSPKKLLEDLDELRVHKSAYEVFCLREANRRAALGHAAVLKAFADGDHSELDLHLLYLKATHQDDPETPYKNIVALGEHAATLHHVSYGRNKVSSQSLLLDAGATFQGYDSDITRTAVKGTGATVDVFGALIAGVDKLQRQLCDDAKVGRNYQELHDESHHHLAQVLCDIGLVKRLSPAAAVDAGITRKLFPHGLGHSLGIQTHDVGCRNVDPRKDNPFLRNTRVIEAGQVFTIEPGCYFIPSLLAELRASTHASSLDWQLVDALTPLGGVRIEDDLVVMDSAGVDNLTRVHLPEERV